MNIQLQVVEGLIGNNSNNSSNNNSHPDSSNNQWHDSSNNQYHDSSNNNNNNNQWHDSKDSGDIYDGSGSKQAMIDEVVTDVELEAHLVRLIDENEQLSDSLDIPNNRDIYQECVVEQARNITLKLIQKALRIPFTKDKDMTKELEKLNIYNAALASLNTCNKNIVF